MTLEEMLNFRRSIRVYDPNKPIDSNVVKKCIELATLAPSSSNMQLWEFHHITDKSVIGQLGAACFGQKAATTAEELVVFVTRLDKYQQRAKASLEFEIENVKRNSPPERQEKRIKDRKQYYSKTMPFLYSRFFGLIGLLRKLIVNILGLFQPTYYQVTENDMKIVAHKSVGLSAQTFMIAMAEKGYDTCPMEGFDSRRVKKILKLPYNAEINMIISCGIRDDVKGLYGDRFRVPFEDVYFKV